MLANFNFPNRGVAEAFAKAQVLLYQASPRFQHYFYSLQKHVSFEASAPTEGSATLWKWKPTATLARTVNSLTKRVPKQHYHVDVLICGIWLWARRQEDELMVRLLQNLLKQGASILCLLHEGTSEGIKQQLRSAVDQKALDRLHFLDRRLVALVV